MPSALETKTVQFIRAAFHNSPYPGDHCIVRMRGSYDIECQQMMNKLAGQRWETVSVTTLASCRDTHCLTPEGYRYFLAAYMCLCIEHYDEADVLTGDLMFQLLPPNDRFHEVVPMLRLEEKRAVKKFLECIGSVHGQDFPDRLPFKALEAYWDKCADLQD